MTELRRLAVGQFEVADAVSPDLLTAASIGQHLRQPLGIVSHLRTRTLSGHETTAVRCGQSISVESQSLVFDSRNALDADSARLDPRVSLVDVEGQLLGIGEFDAMTQRLHPRIIFPIQ